MNREEILRVCEEFTKKNDFKLNPETKIVDMLVDGLIRNEAKKGLKLCPCRVSDGNPVNDVKLICPCNFKIQEEWPKQGRCHCGLFIKR